VAGELSVNEVLDSLWPVLTRRIAERAAAAVDMVDELLRGYGRIQRREHELRAGDRVLNQDRELLPRVSRATSLGLSIYLGNRRIASFSVIDAGSAHEIGGYADAKLVDKVLRGRETFRGELEVTGRRHIVACRPLLASGPAEEYGALGMVEAYQDLDALHEVLASALREGLASSGQSATEEQADRMEAVMLFIDDVARRLQLLALNGNIIAAQAGDHGRAFRVVCRELSSLAEQSKDAVSEVRKLTLEMGMVREDDVDLASLQLHPAEVSPMAAMTGEELADFEPPPSRPFGADGDT
jgi:hypothetical protein